MSWLRWPLKHHVMIWIHSQSIAQEVSAWARYGEFVLQAQHISGLSRFSKEGLNCECDCKCVTPYRLLLSLPRWMLLRHQVPKIKGLSYLLKPRRYPYSRVSFVISSIIPKPTLRLPVFEVYAFEISPNNAQIDVNTALIAWGLLVLKSRLMPPA